jgi:signal peptidase
MFKKILTYTISGLSVLLFIVAIIILIVGSVFQKDNRLFRVFGYSYSVIPTDSMEPTILIGDIIIAKDVPYDDVIEWDIIVFFNEKYQEYFVHRVIRIEDNGDLVTKGDNPDAPIDDDPVTRDNYFGVVVRYGQFMKIGDLVLKYRAVVFIVMIVIFIVIIFQESLTIFKHINEKNQQAINEKYELEKAKLLELEEQKIREELKASKMNSDGINKETK